MPEQYAQTTTDVNSRMIENFPFGRVAKCASASCRELKLQTTTPFRSVRVYAGILWILFREIPRGRNDISVVGVVGAWNWPVDGERSIRCARPKRPASIGGESAFDLVKLHGPF